ncbi:MAG: dephospho-CoA kinase [Cryobacterium sp.]|nr:dephospho-CoA kinase [Oligoflexia bacterium]
MTDFKIFGMTGGVASGKSAVAEYFRALSVPVVDADEIARDLRQPGGAAADALLARFHTLDRTELRSIIARDPRAKADIEAILHPLIAHESAARFAAIREGAVNTQSTPSFAIYEAALLIEAGRATDFEGVILVESLDDLRLSRLMKRDGMREKDARHFLGMQMSDPRASIEKKREASKYKIWNDGTLPELREKVALLNAAIVRGEKTFSV